MTSKTDLWWVSVGGNKCEPARVVSEDGKQVVYTIGCPDGILVTPESGVELVEKMDDPPLTSAASLAAKLKWERKIEREAKLGIFHGYQKFD